MLTREELLERNPELANNSVTHTGENAPSIDILLKDEIDEQFDPKTVDEAEAAELVRNEIQRFLAAEAGLKTTRMNDLSLACAEFAYHQVRHEENPLICDANAWTGLRDRIAAISGEVSQEIEVGSFASGDVRKEVVTTKVFDGIASQYRKGACMRAMLYAIGHMSAVSVGYLARTTKAARFDKFTVWHRVEEVSPENRDKHYRALCVPYNRVRPHVYEIGQNEKNNLMLRPVAGSTDERLHYLSDDWTEALYLHHFAGRELQLDLEQSGNKNPTGWVTGVVARKRKEATANAQARQGDFEAILRRLVTGQGPDSVATKLHVCAATIVARPPNLWGCPENEVRQGAFVCARAALASLNSKQTPKGQEAAELIDLFQTILRHVDAEQSNGDLRFYWLGDDGQRIGEMAPSQQPLKLGTLGVVGAELRKAPPEAGHDAAPIEAESDAAAPTEAATTEAA